MEKSLSGNEICESLNNQVKIMTYKTLTKYNDIFKAMGKHKAICLLYETKKNYGHWVCVFQRGNVIEHFDSYNYMPDDELDFIPENFKIMNETNFPHLTKLLYKSGCNIHYNDYRLQKHGQNINTSGRHCVMRLLLRNLSIDEYYKIMKDLKKKFNYDYDELITILTRFI